MSFPRFHALLSISLLISGIVIFSDAFADGMYSGAISRTNRYAWSENAGWIDFGTTAGTVRVANSSLTGYAWSENLGWISLNCSNDSSCSTVDFKVTNNGEGVLGGYAWSENAGWIQFAPTNGGVTINSSGVFSGYAWGENTGWIVFNCSNESSCGTVDYKVVTHWRPDDDESSSSSSSSSAVATVRISSGNRIETIERRVSEAVASSPRLFAKHPSAPVAASSESEVPAVRILLGIRERLSKRISDRMLTVSSPDALKILQGIQGRLLNRIDARIKALGGQ